MNRRRMILGIALVLSVAYSCNNAEEVNVASDDLTGNSVTYPLLPASYWNITGTVVFNEKKDGSTLVQLKLNGITDTNGNSELPVHLHLGSITTEKAEVAALLRPITIQSGVSETNLSLLADETAITYDDLKQMNACIKIHLSSYGEGKDVVLAAGNVGSAVTEPVAGGRLKIGICKSE